MIIEIEGIDGVGKTTQCRLLSRWFESRGQRSVIVKDLESTELGRQIKPILTTDTKRTKEVELYAFLCCKAHLFSEVIGPEVSNGTHIICDRGIASLLSYFEVSGFKTGFLKEMVATVVPSHFLSTTFLLDSGVGEAIRRNVAKPSHSKFDNMGTEFFEKQRVIFMRLAQENGWPIIDANTSIEQIHTAITDKLAKM